MPNVSYDFTQVTPDPDVAPNLRELDPAAVAAYADFLAEHALLDKAAEALAEVDDLEANKVATVADVAMAAEAARNGALAPKTAVRRERETALRAQSAKTKAACAAYEEALVESAPIREALVNDMGAAQAEATNHLERARSASARMRAVGAVVRSFASQAAHRSVADPVAAGRAARDVATYFTDVHKNDPGEVNSGNVGIAWDTVENAVRAMPVAAYRNADAQRSASRLFLAALDEYLMQTREGSSIRAHTAAILAGNPPIMTEAQSLAWTRAYAAAKAKTK